MLTKNDSTNSLSFAAHSVYDVLKYHAASYRVYQPLESLVKHAGYSLSTVRRALHELEEKQYIHKQPCFNHLGGSLPNCYLLKERAFKQINAQV